MTGSAAHRYTANSVRRRILSVLDAWGMPKDTAATTADVMVDTDLSGVDSHGISMLMMYGAVHDGGRLELAARPEVVVDLPAFSVVDAHHGLGHSVGVHGMELPVSKARQCETPTTSVRSVRPTRTAPASTPFPSTSPRGRRATTSPTGSRSTASESTQSRKHVSPKRQATPAASALSGRPDLPARARARG